MPDSDDAILWLAYSNHKSSLFSFVLSLGPGKITFCNGEDGIFVSFFP